MADDEPLAATVANGATDQVIARSAAALIEGFRTGEAVAREALGGLVNVDDAYQVQDLVLRGLQQDDDRPAGYKVSFTLPEVQAWVGASEPASGPFLPEQVLPDASRIGRSEFRDPVLEPEVLFHLVDDLPPDPSREDVRERTRVSLGIEICDSRVDRWLAVPQIAHIIADCAATGVLIVGARTPRPVPEELGSVQTELAVDGRTVEVGSGERVMGDPIEAVRWLARWQARRGRKLQRGMVISSGALTPRPFPATTGRYLATSPQLGEVSVELI